MKLLIDIGNSRIKWAGWINSRLQEPRALSHGAWHPRALLSGCTPAGQRPEQVYIANVAGREIGAKIAAAVRKHWRLTPVFIRVRRSSLGVTNAYANTSQLGVDRWLAIIAAWHRYQTPVCVVSCGTAVTIDAVSPAGRHLGGLIIPGLSLMQSQLIQATRGIRLNAGRDYGLKFGRNTTACVRHGAARSIVALIEDVTGELIREYGRSLARVITGGDAERINAKLGKKFRHDPNLVLHGLGLLSERER